MKYKVMRMICMFDLPVETSEEQRIYRTFRKNLIKEGFIMMQYSVYIRTCPNRGYCTRLENRMQKFMPEKGNVRIIYQDFPVSGLLSTDMEFRNIYLTNIASLS